MELNANERSPFDPPRYRGVCTYNLSNLYHRADYIGMKIEVHSRDNYNYMTSHVIYLPDIQSKLGNLKRKVDL